MFNSQKCGTHIHIRNIQNIHFMNYLKAVALHEMYHVVSMDGACTKCVNPKYAKYLLLCVTFVAGNKNYIFCYFTYRTNFTYLCNAPIYTNAVK